MWNGSAWTYSINTTLRAGSVATTGGASIYGNVESSSGNFIASAGHGYTVTGKDNTYVLLAGGGASKLKTVNGYSLFGEGNIDASGGGSGAYVPIGGGTMTGQLQVNAPILGYNYTNSNNAPAFIFDKPGSYYTGIGANGESDTIYFGAVFSGQWITSYIQKWKFGGHVYAQEIYVGNVNIPGSGDRITFNNLTGTYNKGIIAMNSSNTYIEAPLASDSSSANKTPILIGWRGNSYALYATGTSLGVYTTSPQATLDVNGVTYTKGLRVTGRVYGSGDDEGILVTYASNGVAGLILGSSNTRRSIFYLTGGESGTAAPFWRYRWKDEGDEVYNTGDISPPKKSGTIALTSDITPDTKNTTGGDNTTSKIYLTGMTAQTTNDGYSRTYTNSNVFVDTDGTLQAVGFKTSSGTSSGFLKADGSVDSNTYALQSSISDYLPLAGGTMTGAISLPRDKRQLTFRDSSSYGVYLYYHTSDDEALTFSTKNAATSYIFMNGATDSDGTGYASLGNPALQIKNNKVSIACAMRTQSTESSSAQAETLLVNGDTRTGNFTSDGWKRSLK